MVMCRWRSQNVWTGDDAHLEPLSASSAFARASARTQVPCLICPETLGRYIFSPRRMPHCDPSPLHHDLKAADRSASRSNCWRHPTSIVAGQDSPSRY
jgi:hypothetical protein